MHHFQHQLTTMQILRRGPEPCKLAVVACLHGDETAGKQAVNEILTETNTFNKGVKFIIANTQAAERGVRCIDDDANRCFPGCQSADSHERQLAAELLQEVSNHRVLDLHTTVSYPKPVAFIKGWSDTKRNLALATAVPRVVDVASDKSSHDFFSGSLIETASAVSVECGIKDSEQAVINAKYVIRSFLTTNGAITEQVHYPNSVELYKLNGVIEKEDDTKFEFVAENFEEVRQGEKFALGDGQPFSATEAFYPVLMSTNGYEDILGYKAKKVTTLKPGK